MGGEAESDGEWRCGSHLSVEVTGGRKRRVRQEEQHVEEKDEQRSSIGKKKEVCVISLFLSEPFEVTVVTLTARPAP